MCKRGRLSWYLDFGQAAFEIIIVDLEGTLNLRPVSGTNIIGQDWKDLPSKRCFDFKCLLITSARTVPLNLQPANLQKIFVGW
jgi:hypothetical protein